MLRDVNFDRTPAIWRVHRMDRFSIHYLGGSMFQYKRQPFYCSRTKAMENTLNGGYFYLRKRFY